jgi:hypothetical protein
MFFVSVSSCLFDYLSLTLSVFSIVYINLYICLMGFYCGLFFVNFTKYSICN